MNLEEFATKIFNRFPLDNRSEEARDSIMCDFIRAIDDGRVYDYENAFIDLLRSYSFKTTPPAKIVIECLRKFEIKKKITTPAIVYETLIGCKNGVEYEFALNCPLYDGKKILFDKGFSDVKIKTPIERAY